MASTRLDIRLDEAIKEKAEKAAALLGLKSLTEYVVRLMDQDATQVIAQHENLVIADNLFDQFMQACETTEPPNQALRDAAAFTQEQGLW
ncbi:MAG: DUF1778 domain-containing protein [Candidatus Melainabacteria bacterium HGW-Melainabacteria-1]|nr:MAG: DUF1778 domain-containing protein [Candidatus Melainabacteria bacterium HGW-Melainabacteria-1]